jgi:hypothetical protein
MRRRNSKNVSKLKQKFMGQQRRTKEGQLMTLSLSTIKMIKTEKDSNKLTLTQRFAHLIESKNLDAKNNSGFNLITGEDRFKIAVPHHDRYNPILS